MPDQIRCAWCSSNALYQNYHDTEWSKELHEDRALFELLCLEGFQSGLSWLTILKKREHFNMQFENFNFEKLAEWTDEKQKEALQNPNIIRNRLKIQSVKTNAIAFIKIREKFGSFDRYIWEFVDFKPILNQFQSLKDLPARTEISDKISKSLKKNGFRFVGPTICYSFMQAIGMTIDHTVDCFCHPINNP